VGTRFFCLCLGERENRSSRGGETFRGLDDDQQRGKRGKDKTEIMKDRPLLRRTLGVEVNRGEGEYLIILLGEGK